MSEPLRITSRQNPRVKDAARLRTSKERKRSGRFIIDGAREISRAIAEGIRGLEAYICDGLCDSAEADSTLELLRGSGVATFHVSRDVYAKLAFGERDEGIVVVAETPQRSLSDLRLPANPLVAVLEAIEKPGNVGAILRSADAAGVDAVIIADARSDLYNPNTIRASLGTVFRHNVCAALSGDALAWLGSHKLAVVAAKPDAERSYSEVDFRRGVAIVLGSEAAGLSDAWRGAGVTSMRLPMCGIADSLNVSTTAAVLFYEAQRQRTSETKL